MIYKKLTAYFRLIRVSHWIKNGFVLAPLVFARQFEDVQLCIQAGWAFLSFCLLASAVYILNDLCDREEDAQHPDKRERPLASGAVGVNEAAVLIGLLMIASLVIGWYQSMQMLGVLLFYLGLSVAYSLGLKHVAILDVMAIAAGFVLRILAGALAVNVPLSHWLVLCTIMISLFLGFTKRRAELVAMKESAENTRKVLQDYSVAFLDQVIPMVTAATIICYALYTVDGRTVEMFKSRAMLLTVPCVIYGLFRYIYLIYHQHKGQDPTYALCHDVPTIANLIIWVGLSVVVIKYGAEFNILG